MRVVKDEGELAAGYVAYSTEQAVRMAQTLRAEDSFAQVRAAANLKRLRSQIDRVRNTTNQFRGNKNLQQQWDRNTVILQGAEKQARLLDQTLERGLDLDNRGNLNEYYESQTGSRSSNVVQEGGTNFAVDMTPDADTSTEATGQFDGDWFAGNELANVDAIAGADEAGLARSAGDEEVGRIFGLDELRKLPSSGGKGRAQPRAPEVAQGEQKRILKKTRSMKRKGQRGRKEEVSDRVGRYQQALEKEADRYMDKVAPRTPMSDADDTVHTPASGSGFFAGAAGMPMLPSGLVSLDVHIPTRGILYQFTTPRGDVKITARAVSRTFLANLARWAIVFAVIAVLWRGYKFVLQERFADKYVRTISIALIVAGLASVLTGVLPLAGVLALIVGLVRRFGIRKNWEPR